jgi:thiamine biosynthesis lipoprotein
MTTRSFRSMGCEVVVAGGSVRAFGRIVELFEQRDRLFSRFRTDSELARVNAWEMTIVPISPEFARAVVRALEAARQTGGVVDPTVGAAVVGAGYDRDFRDLVAGTAPPALPTPADWREVAVGDGILRRPHGTVLDLNGVVKAMAVDDAASLLDGPGYVSAGGDLAARGTPVAVSLPDGEAVTLERGGIATSGTTRRRWLRGGTVQHHLIDPRTGVPAQSPWQEVTAVGRSCLAADVAAKAGFLLGHAGPDWLDARGVAARFATADGVFVENGGWARALRREPVAA